MKLLATIQIAVLLITSIIPDGKTCVSAGGCGCSAADRSAGTCCCSTGSSGCCSTGSSGCCSTATASCCSAPGTASPARAPSCCQTDTSQQPAPSTGTAKGSQSGDPRPSHRLVFRSTCPCGGSAPHTIALMPRIQCSSTPGPRLINNGRHLGVERPDVGRLKDEPESPPPQIG